MNADEALARVPPQAIPAEQAVLGGLMIAPGAWAEVSDMLGAADFYRRDHGVIWSAIKHLAEKGQPFDAITLGEFTERKGLDEQIGGMQYLIKLASDTHSAANIRAHAEIVADKGRLRRMIDVAASIVDDAFGAQGMDSVEIISKAQTRMSDLLQSQPCDLEEIGPVIKRMFAALQKRYDARGMLDGLSTGLPELDRVLNGLKGGRVYVIAARPKAGKTTLALNIAESVAIKQEKPVSIFSFEMTQEQLTERLVCSIGSIDHGKFRTGEIDDEDWPRVGSAIKTLRESPIRLSRPRNVRIESLVAQARRLHARIPQSLIIVDYLQLLDTKGSENRTQGITEVSRQLKMLAIDLDVPLVVLSQLNRGVESRADKRPMLSDLRESGAIEQDADAVIFIYRDETYHPDSADRGTAEINVAAQRDGPSEMIRVAARLHLCRFDALADGWCRAEQPDAFRPQRSGFRKGSHGNRSADRAVGGQ